MSPIEVNVVLNAREVVAGEELGHEDDLRALVGGATHQVGHEGDVGCGVVAERGLDRADGHICVHERWPHDLES